MFYVLLQCVWAKTRINKNKSLFSASDEYKLNYIIEPDRNNEDVFAMMKPLLLSAIEGYNICIIAYGASGKTL